MNIFEFNNLKLVTYLTMNFNPLAVGRNVRKHRLYNEINQSWLANKVGISRKTLINYEKGYTPVPTALWLKFTDTLNTTLECLLEEIPPPKI
jgi:DNA-binding XRE family transcriptional regulator